MSPTTTDEDSLISQDDIDKLLNASSMDEAEESIGSPEEEMGELSPDDIDSLMNISTADEEEEGDLSPEFEGDADDELVSQDDIDTLLNSALADPGSLESSDTGAGEEEDLELISQDDIGRLLGNVPETDSSPTDNQETAQPALDSSDVTRTSGPDNPEMKEGILSYDEPIDASEAVDIQGCFITQETLDGLLAADEAAPEPEPAKASEPDSDLDTDADLQSDGEFDTFLETELDEDIEEWTSEGQDISQDDIDNLLKEAGDGDDSDSDSDETLISQEDINVLLTGSLEDDGDLLNEDDADPELAESMDLFEEEGFEDDELKVVLDESPEPSGDDNETVAMEDRDPPEKSWYRSKLLMAALVVGLLLVIGLPVGYFTLFKGDKTPQPPAQEMITMQAKPQPVPVIETKSVDINLQIPHVGPDPGTVDLKNFVVLAPAKQEGFGYIAADLSLDYSNIKAFDAIDRQLPLYRGIIYDAMHQALNSDKKDKVTETELLKLVKDALNKALPESYIEKVSFISFKTG